MHYCVYRCYHEFEYFLHDRFVELREQPRYELKGIEPQVFINAVYSYLEKNGIINNPTVLHLMIGHSSMDLSSILDFFNWLKEQDESFNIYKMPEII